MMMPNAALEAAHLIDRLDRLARSGGASGDLNPAQWEALRFVSRANRFSRTPAALAEYLGSTRGTISQTLIALEQKGCITREQSPRDRRSIMLELTAAGQRLLRDDPLRALASDLAKSAPERLEDIVDMLRDTLLTMLARNGGRPFGACYTCRHFASGGGSSARAPHRCKLLDEGLSESDSSAICIEQQPAAAS